MIRPRSTLPVPIIYHAKSGISTGFCLEKEDMPRYFMTRPAARGVAQWLSASALGAESRGFDPRRPDHFCPGANRPQNPLAEGKKHRPQMNLHDVFPSGSFPPARAEGIFYGGCLALLGLRPAMLTHASRRSPPPRPFFAGKKWSMKPSGFASWRASAASYGAAVLHAPEVRFMSRLTMKHCSADCSAI